MDANQSRMMYRSVAPRKLHEDVVEQIQSLIVTGQLPMGERLPPEAELAMQFGVSRTVVREAIQILQERGLVEVKQGQGSLVTAPTIDIIVSALRLLAQVEGASTMEVAEARDVIEIGMSALAAERATSSNLRTLERSLRRMEESLGEVEDFLDADVAFHRELARSTQNKVLAMLIAPVFELMREARGSIVHVPGAAERALQYHRLIYEAMKAGRREEAQDAMHQHIQQVREEIQKLQLGEKPAAK